MKHFTNCMSSLHWGHANPHSNFNISASKVDTVLCFEKVLEWHNIIFKWMKGQWSPKKLKVFSNWYDLFFRFLSILKYVSCEKNHTCIHR